MLYELKGEEKMEKSAMYKLFELKDNIQEGINNASNVKEQQEELAEILKNQKNTKSDFSGLIKSIGETSEDLEKQIGKMSNRLVDLNYILDIYNNGFKENASAEDKFKKEFVDEIVTKVMFALGVVSEEEITDEKQN